MELTRQLSDWGLGLLVSLGLLVASQVGFTPPVLESSRADRQEWHLVADLKGAVTPELISLLEHSVSLGLEVNARIYRTDGRRTTWTGTSWLQFRSLDRSLHLLGPEGEFIFAGSSGKPAARALAAWCRCLVPLDPEGVRFVILEARLDIPELEDKSLVLQIWDGQVPSITWLAGRGGSGP